MRWNGMARAVVGAVALLACAGLAMTAAPAAAQRYGDLRYMRGYDLLPNPPVTGRPTTLVLYGVYPTGCGAVESKSDSPVAIRLRSYGACPDSAIGTWAESFSLGMLAVGTYTLTLTITMDRPDSGVTVQQGTLTMAPPTPTWRCSTSWADA